MPYKSDKLKINNELLDKRVKITQEDKAMIREMYKDGLSQRQLATIFNVSRRSIVFALYPERYKSPNWKKYFDRKKHNDYQSKHRKYKRQLLEEGKI